MKYAHQLTDGDRQLVSSKRRSMMKYRRSLKKESTKAFRRNYRLEVIRFKTDPDESLFSMEKIASVGFVKYAD